MKNYGLCRKCFHEDFLYRYAKTRAKILSILPGRNKKFWKRNYEDIFDNYYRIGDHDNSLPENHFMNLRTIITADLVHTEEQLKLLKGRLATPCQIHLKNAVTFNTKMELLPCDMYIYQRLGKFGRDFSSYQGFLSLTESANYSKTMDEIRRLPSDECTTCEHFGVCYGGCPVLWKNYLFSALKEFKAKAHHSGVSGE